ncbi:DgyrCDS493 [Dimorphilus gyrociliatus]|uniref:DgyrCDS493 n=1 Tax=Dimorphilus gyrociliatus TaxID=2664684 RepID=A0A7I8V4L6_9ANNE|nr:DgyrCDS493 [Dimorphilus gyrociliatus]
MAAHGDNNLSKRLYNSGQREYELVKRRNRRISSLSNSQMFQPLKDKQFWKAVAAEFIAVAILIVVGCSTTRAVEVPGTTVSQSNILRISFGFGLTVAVLVSATAHISGGHLNPAVSFGLLIARRFSFVKFLIYSLAQICGSIVGAAILKGVQGEVIGVNEPADGVSSSRSFGIETVITFVLVFTVLSCTDSRRSDSVAPVPLFVGLAITCCHLFAADVSGSAMNPARALGPSIIASKYKDHWVYWVGGFLGAFIAAVVYEYMLAPDASIEKVKNVFARKSLDSDSQPEKSSDKKDNDPMKKRITPTAGSKTELQTISTED